MSNEKDLSKEWVWTPRVTGEIPLDLINSLELPAWVAEILTRLIKTNNDLNRRVMDLENNSRSHKNLIVEWKENWSKINLGDYTEEQIETAAKSVDAWPWLLAFIAENSINSNALNNIILNPTSPQILIDSYLTRSLNAKRLVELWKRITLSIDNVKDLVQRICMKDNISFEWYYDWTTTLREYQLFNYILYILMWRTDFPFEVFEDKEFIQHFRWIFNLVYIDDHISKWNVLGSHRIPVRQRQQYIADMIIKNVPNKASEILNREWVTPRY